MYISTVPCPAASTPPPSPTRSGSPAGTSSASPSSSLTSSRQMFGSPVPRAKGKGKGGVLRIVRNSFEKETNEPNLTVEWKRWKTEESLRITAELKKIKKSSISDVQCQKCLKYVKTKTFLNHTTKPPGCKEMNRFFKLKFFVEYYRKYDAFPVNTEYKL